MLYSNKKQIQTVSLQTQAQFNHVLNQRTRVSSFYFVLHYCINNLSTVAVEENRPPVDKCVYKVSRLGLIIPKRWAKKAVTRSLIKRQCRAQFAHFANELPAGDWVLRLRQPFKSDEWRSCSSGALKTYVRQELQHLFQKSVGRGIGDEPGDCKEEHLK